MSNLEMMLYLSRLKLRQCNVHNPDTQSLVAAANEGKNELVKVIRQAREDYFCTTTSLVIPTATAPNPSEAMLPEDCAEFKDIQVTTAGYEDIEFEALDHADPRFRQACQNGVVGVSNPDLFYYDIIGRRYIHFAPAAQIELTTTIYYVQIVYDMVLPADAPTPIPAEFYDFIVSWMVVEILRPMNAPQFATYMQKLADQRESVVQAVNARQIREANYVRGFMEGSW